MSHEFNNTDIAPTDSDGDPQMDGGFGGSGFGTTDSGFVVSETKKKSVSSGTLLIVLLVVLAAGGLWSMRTLAIAMAGSGADDGLESTIESFLESLSGVSSESNNAAITSTFEEGAGDVLVDDRTEKQVPLSEVQKNPFLLFVERRAAAPDTNTGPVNSTEMMREQKIDDFETAAAKLRVLMILGGSDPMANISGRVVHVGDVLWDDRIDVELTVTEITDGMVTLVGEDRELDLTHEIVLRLHQNG